MYLATVVLPGHAGFGCTHLAVVNHAMMRCWRDKPLADVSVLTLGKLHHISNAAATDCGTQHVE